MSGCVRHVSARETETEGEEGRAAPHVHLRRVRFNRYNSQWLQFVFNLQTVKLAAI